MTPGASRPGRALRGGMVVLAVAVAWRVPAIEREFAAALAAGAEPRRATTLAAVPPPPARPNTVGVPSPDTAALPAGEAILVSATRMTQLAEPLARRTSMRAADVAAAALPRKFRTGGYSGPGWLPLRLLVAPVPDPADGAAGRAGGVRPPRPDAAAPPQSPGDRATAAYAALAAGDRREAVRLFDAALAGDDPRAPEWQRQRDRLTRRWSAAAYSIVRARSREAATVPVLGGSQSGAAIAFIPDPLSPRPLALTLRGTAAHDDGGRSSFVAAGVQWRPFTGVAVAAERLVAIGPEARNEWAVRLAAGGDRRIGRLHLTGYGEGGIIGGAPYAAVQARAAAAFDLHQVALEPGGGAWASFQHDRTTVDRVDIGPGLVARLGHIAVEADYRFRVAGNAAPASGPVLTVSAAF